MAITYQFYCGVCQNSDKFSIGSTQESNQRGESAFELACCENCKRLTNTNTKSCPHCGTPAEYYKYQPDSWKFIWRRFLEDLKIKKSFHTGFRIIPLNQSSSNNRIYCPRCKQMAVKALPILYN
ncbi:MAG: hypothetical protein EOO99_10130 [Pedobacter sp.]|nr:MAG: hypothetical protein EOO99_10130 [Pedobacter sp.]